jgi:L-2,4-diaminobutyric acid acetyltransferase
MNSIVSSNITLRTPERGDGAALHNLVAECPPLDENSLYCNLLQATHFADTCIAAEQAGHLVGFISAYLVPGRPETLFVWQVAVGPRARGQGLATRMLDGLLGRPRCRGVTHLETTVTASNEASWALFEGFARKHGAPLLRSTLFDRDADFDGAHDSEILARIGPLAAVAA